MTKMKSKKMTKSTFAIIIMAVVMVAMIAFGGTYAYFTATANSVTDLKATTAVIQLNSDAGPEGTAIATARKEVLPGEELAHVKVGLTDLSTRDTYVFATVTLKFNNRAIDLTNDKAVTLTWGSGNIWTTEVNGAKDGSYVFVVARNNFADGTDDTTLAADTFSFEVTLTLNNVEENFAQGEDKDNLDYMGKDVTVEVTFSAIQQLGFIGDEMNGESKKYATQNDAYKAAYNQIATTIEAENADQNQTSDAPSTPADPE